MCMRVKQTWGGFQEVFSTHVLEYILDIFILVLISLMSLILVLIVLRFMNTFRVHLGMFSL